MARILIIDDSTVMRQLMVDYLSHVGHSVDSCDNGQCGVEMALKEQYDVIICDLHMPRISGYEVLETVLAGKSAPRFIFTDSMPDQLAEKVQRLGPYPYIKKPFELAQLRAILDRLLIPAKHP